MCLLRYRRVYPWITLNTYYLGPQEQDMLGKCLDPGLLPPLKQSRRNPGVSWDWAVFLSVSFTLSSLLRFTLKKIL